MRYYVRMLDGQVDSKPFPLSSDESESPNIHWGIDQMKKNDFLPCQITFDPVTEEPDYENPQVYENMVEYTGKLLSETKRKQLYNQEQDKRRQAEYPTITEKVDAIWLAFVDSDLALLEYISEKIRLINEKYPKET